MSIHPPPRNDHTTARRGQRGVPAYGAGALRVVQGANLGDPVGGAEECQPGDIYRLRADAKSRRILLAATDPAEGAMPQYIATGSAVGTAGDALWPLALLTLLSATGERVVVVTAWLEPADQIFAIALSPLVPGADYTLIDIDADTSRVALADVICVSFAAGTLITLPGGRQAAIERLRPGDPVLTRDSGPQTLRWIGKATLRATGGFAPVVISAGTLGNLGDLIVSPHHRLFLYQRGAARIGPQAEVLVQAKHLVDDQRVWRREGGYVDYYSLAFDRHEIIFAEGTAAESLCVTDDSLQVLPPALAEDLRTRFPGLSHAPHFAPEAGRAALDGPALSRILRPGS
jgi:hypothetical protein